MKISVISTSRVAAVNLGDDLIAERCIALVKDLAPNATITKIFRGESWSSVAHTVRSSDLVVVACLAIRKGMLDKAYPYLRELVESKTPICVIAAGLSLGAFALRGQLHDHLSQEEQDVLRKLGERCRFFSTRGYLTQSLMDDIGAKSTFAGDVAFYQPRFADRKFTNVERIARIAVSDPHYTPTYRESFLYLIDRLRDLFPESGIDLLIHGRNDEVIPIAEQAGVPVIKMYDQRGLNHYDDYDLHVGYRIHGHVSALVRRMPSYLLEQDDRGTDYGTTFSRRISIASHRNISRRSPVDSEIQVLTYPIDALVATLKQDMAQGFARFHGLEEEVEACASRNYEGLKEAMQGLEPRQDTGVDGDGFSLRRLASRLLRQ